MRQLLVRAVLLAALLCGCARREPKPAGQTDAQTTSGSQKEDQAHAGPRRAFDLIEKAVAAGSINKETALLYKVFSDFEDQRLPAVYRGSDDDFFEARSLRAAQRAWPSLSQQTRDMLAPFIMRPDEAGSWNELSTAKRTAALERRKSWPNLFVASAVAAPAPGRIQWKSVVVTVGGVDKARMWWMPDRRPQDEARAMAFKAELERYLWKKLTDPFGEPLPDDRILARDGSVSLVPPHGPDALLDIYLTGIGRSYETSFQRLCDGTPRPGFIALSFRADKSELGHELMHAIIDGYPLLGCHNDYNWMNEATATWSQHFTYPDNKEHASAADFMMFPEDRLNVVGGTTGSHEYGAYLWFLNLSGPHIDPDPVKKTWEAAKNNDDIGAIDKVAGGFKKQWPIFLANNWNDGPHRDYYNWDKLTDQAREDYTFPNKTVKGIVEISLPHHAAAIFPIHHEIAPLAAQYTHFAFRPDPQLRQIWFKNDYAGSDPRALVQAIVKIRGHDWQRAVDWSNDRMHVFCRDRPGEDVEELVIIVSNLDLENAQDFRDLPPKLGGDETINQSPLELRVSALPCNDWVGSIEFSSTQSGTEGHRIVTSSKATDVRFQMDLGRTALSGGAMNYYKATGTVKWEINERSSGCSDKNVFGTFPAEGMLAISLGLDSLFYIFKNESRGSTETLTVSCPGGPTEFTFSFGNWMPFSFMGTLAGDATELAGSQEDTPGERDGWKWRFSKVLPPP